MTTEFYTKLRQRYLDIIDENVALKYRMGEVRDVVEEIEKHFRNNPDIMDSYRIEIERRRSLKKQGEEIYLFKETNRNNFFQFLEEKGHLPDKPAISLQFLYRESSDWKHNIIKKESTFIPVLASLNEVYMSLFKEEDLSFIKKVIWENNPRNTNTSTPLIKKKVYKLIIGISIAVFITIVALLYGKSSLVFPKKTIPEIDYVRSVNKDLITEAKDSFDSEPIEKTIISFNPVKKTPPAQTCCQHSKRVITTFGNTIRKRNIDQITVQYLEKIQKEMIYDSVNCEDRQCENIKDLQNLFDEIQMLSEKLSRVEMNFVDVGVSAKNNLNLIEEKQKMTLSLLIFLCKELGCSADQMKAYQNLLKSYTDD